MNLVSRNSNDDELINLRIIIPTAFTSAQVIIEGAALGVAIEKMPDELLQLCHLSKSVICCRVTPQQKADVVAMVKRTGEMTLAIGDGGNDVSMIQEAHVGVGIEGREGLQAARASDYSFSRFKFLARLMLIHGRYTYNRTCFIAQYCFYKSQLVCICQILFNLFCGFSGSSLFTSFSLMTYNGVFTAFPVITYALNQDVSYDVSMKVPQLYLDSQRSQRLSAMTFLGWIGWAVLHGSIVFGVTFLIWGPGYSHPSDGSPEDQISSQLVAFTALILINQLTLALETDHFTWINHLLIWGIIPIYFATMIVYNILPAFESTWAMFRLMADVNFWGAELLIVVATLGPRIALKYYKYQYHPTLWEEVQWNERTTRASCMVREEEMTASGAGDGLDGMPSGLQAPLLR